MTKADATKRRSKVVIPDFAELEEAINQDSVRRPVEMAIIESRRVREPVTARLREFGLRTLSDYVGDPVEAVGTGKTMAYSPQTSTSGVFLILSNLVQKGMQLRKAAGEAGP